MSSNNQPTSTTATNPSSTTSTQTTTTTTETTDFPVGPTARKNLKNLLRRSKNPAQEITTFQTTQSLHSVYSRAFHTTPQHELPSQKTRSHTKKAAAAAAAAAAAKNTTTPPTNRPPESFRPDPALTFLNHLGVSRFSIHSKIALALRTALEEEIRRLPLPQCRDHLLSLLKACWIPSNTVTELRPVLVSVVKRLGDSTPESVLRRLAEREEGEDGKLKYGELLSLFDVRIRRLVWEADWDGRSSSPATAEGTPAATPSGGGPNTSLLAELTREAAMIYYADEELIEHADFAFFGAIGLRRVDTPSRRGINAAGVTSAAAAATTTSVSVVPAGGEGKEGGGNDGDDGKKKSAIAVQKLKEIIGDRPKLLGAVLTTLMMEHGLLITSETASINPANETLLLGYSTSGTVGRRSLTGALVSDVILTYGSLPKSYEHLGILAKILDQSVRAGLISDDAIAQIQGCLKHIFHQFETAERRERSPSTTTVTETATASSSSTTAKSSSSSTTAKSSTSSNGGSSIFKPEEKKYNPHDDKPFLRNLLKQVVTAALTAMKQSDHQGLFLNPVTDAIAPGYSTIVKEPMCIKTMDEKLHSNQYQSLSAYERDVRLMFQNCIDYNIGKEGAWFRGEARRQCKIWKDNILTQAKELLRKEMVKRKRELEKKKGSNGDNPTSSNSGSPPKGTKSTTDKKRQRDTIAAAIAAAKKNKVTKSTPAFTSPTSTTSPNTPRRPVTDKAVIRLTKTDIAPLPALKPKKRKVTSDHPSPPAIASLMLSDPFVVRLLIDKTLRYLRMETVKEKSLPGLHYAIPSLLQLLYLSQCSPQLCVNKGRRFFVPDCGSVPPPSSEDEEDDRPTSTIPHLTLRRYLPLLTHLLVRCQLDLRLSSPGDLSSIPVEDHPPPHLPSYSSDGTHLCVVRALVQGSLIHSLIPSGGSLASRRTAERSLAIQLPRFFKMLEGVATRVRLVTERPFWMSLARVLLRYKTKLSVGVRDEVLEFALRWLRRGEEEDERSRKRKRKKKDLKNKVVNGLRSPAHEVMIWLLNEWSNLGNQIMPRDKLLEASETLGKVGEAKKTNTEKEDDDDEEEEIDDNDDDDNNFASLWIDAGDGEETKDDNKNKNTDDVTTTTTTTTIERRIRHQYEIMLRNVDETHAESWKKTMGIDEESLKRLKAAREKSSSSSSNEMTDSAKKKKKKRKKKRGVDEEKKEEEKNGKGGGGGKEEDDEEEDDGSGEG